MTLVPLARRSATSIVALGLAAGALVAGTGAAQADAATDVTGVVTNLVGAPLANIEVTAYTIGTNAGTDREVDTATTDAGGRFNLTDLDAASLTGTASQGATSFKLIYRDANTYPAASYRATLPFLPGFLAGADTLRRSAAVTVVPGGVVTVPNTPLEQSAGILATLTGPTGAPVQNAQVTAFNSDDSAASEGLSTDDDAGTTAPKDGVVVVKNLKASDGPVSVFGSGSDLSPFFVAYLGTFFGGANTFASAADVTLTPGAFTNVTFRLTNQLTPTQAPRIVGDSSFGSTLRADPGTWTRTAGTTYAYQWLRGSTVVSSSSSYKLSKSDRRGKILLRVTAFNDDFVGAASTVLSTRVGEKSKATAKKNKDGSYAVRVVVAKAKLARKLGTPTGKVVLVDQDGTLVSKKVKLRNGRATLDLKKPVEGKLTVTYLGGGKLGSDSGPVGKARR